MPAYLMLGLLPACLAICYFTALTNTLSARTSPNRKPYPVPNPPLPDLQDLYRPRRRASRRLPPVQMAPKIPLPQPPHIFHAVLLPAIHAINHHRPAPIHHAGAERLDAAPGPSILETIIRRQLSSSALPPPLDHKPFSPLLLHL
jgi:hypothetical protein